MHVGDFGVYFPYNVNHFGHWSRFSRHCVVYRLGLVGFSGVRRVRVSVRIGLPWFSCSSNDDFVIAARRFCKFRCNLKFTWHVWQTHWCNTVLSVFLVVKETDGEPQKKILKASSSSWEVEKIQLWWQLQQISGLEFVASYCSMYAEISVK